MRWASDNWGVEIIDTQAPPQTGGSRGGGGGGGGGVTDRYGASNYEYPIAELIGRNKICNRVRRSSGW